MMFSFDRKSRTENTVPLISHAQNNQPAFIPGGTMPMVPVVQNPVAQDAKKKHWWSRK
jgi:hypothetical protein